MCVWGAYIEVSLAAFRVVSGIWGGPSFTTSKAKQAVVFASRSIPVVGAEQKWTISETKSL